jgi:hypothetical protein
VTAARALMNAASQAASPELRLGLSRAIRAVGVDIGAGAAYESLTGHFGNRAPPQDSKLAQWDFPGFENYTRAPKMGWTRYARSIDDMP